MTYTLEAVIEKIDCPVIVEYKGKETVFRDGKEAMNSKWQDKMRISSIATKESSIILKMEQIDPMPQITWVGEEACPFSV